MCANGIDTVLFDGNKELDSKTLYEKSGTRLPTMTKQIRESYSVFGSIISSWRREMCIRDRDYTLSNITINTLQAVITGLIIMIAVPILLIIIGIVVWAMRRKK